jgi:hypothetical protein
MKTTAETRLLITAVKAVFRSPEKYSLTCSEGNAEALAETADFRLWLPQQTESHFAQPIEEAIENGIPADAVSLANYVLWWYADEFVSTVTFEENEA